MKLKYLWYQFRCRLADKTAVDFVEFVGRMLFTKEGVRV